MCTGQLSPKIDPFCYHCGTPRQQDWTTGNKSLDSFIMESWSNVKHEDDAYIQWIECYLLTNVQEMTLLRYECTHRADWLDPTAKKPTRVTLKRIIDAQSSGFYQVIISHINNANSINHSCLCIL